MDNQNMGMSESRGTAGPIIGLVVILAVIIIGGVYAFRSIKHAEKGYSSGADDADIPAEIKTQSTSDEASDIQADLDAFGPTQIDSSAAF